MNADVPSVLETIVAASRRRVEAARAVVSRGELDVRLAHVPAQGRAERFRATLAAEGVRVIAECKRRSPSRGILRHDYDAPAIALRYAQAGAAAISVLTEPSFFDGALAHLEAARAAVDVPLLRKDFVVDEYQVAEAAAAGADAVLLIAAALDQDALVQLLEAAAGICVAALVEVHDEDEARRAVDAGAAIIGVNNRNLKTLAVSLDTAHRVRHVLPDTCLTVAESGLRTGADVAALMQAGYDAFLVGERFMTEPDPGAGLAGLIGEATRAVEGLRT
jgi:indole-3-glycerol phosphate synthase